MNDGVWHPAAQARGVYGLKRSACEHFSQRPSASAGGGLLRRQGMVHELGGAVSGRLGAWISIDNSGFVGVAFVIGVAWALSDNRTKFPWRIVAVALGLEIALAVSMFALPPLRALLTGVSAGIDGLQAATLEGARFVFGYLAGGATPYVLASPENSTVLAFGVLPLIIVVSALSALLWRWGVLEWACRGLGFVLRKTMGIGGALGLATAANIFLGMVEAPLVVRPYLERMSRADLFVIMTTGMATIAGTVMALYASFLSGTSPDAAGHILVASFMAAPGSIAIARVMMPAGDEQGAAAAEKAPRLYRSSMDAARACRTGQHADRRRCNAAGGGGVRCAGHDSRKCSRRSEVRADHRAGVRLDILPLHVDARHSVARRTAGR
jgi:hypothetical protein